MDQTTSSPSVSRIRRANAPSWRLPGRGDVRGLDVDPAPGGRAGPVEAAAHGTEHEQLVAFGEVGDPRGRVPDRDRHRRVLPVDRRAQREVRDLGAGRQRAEIG